MKLQALPRHAHPAFARHSRPRKAAGLIAVLASVFAIYQFTYGQLVPWWIGQQMTEVHLLTIVAAFLWILAFGGWLAERIEGRHSAPIRQGRGR